MSARELAEIMLDLQGRGCHNINFVTPTHYAPQLMAALPLAIEQGFRLPLVYNCGGYESLEVIQLLDGIVDIYLPDIKFLDPAASERYLDGAADYPEVVRTVLQEMHRQVGDLVLDAHGIAQRGLIVRHLVMPGLTQDSQAILRFIADELSPQTYVNIMDQYRPCFQAGRSPEIARRTTPAEHQRRRGDGPWAWPAPGLTRILIDYGQSKSADDHSQYWHHLTHRRRQDHGHRAYLVLYRSLP